MIRINRSNKGIDWLRIGWGRIGICDQSHKFNNLQAKDIVDLVRQTQMYKYNYIN